VPRYYVNFWSENGSVVDEEGLELSCLGEALQMIYDLAHEITVDDPLEAHWTGCRFEVTDDDGDVLLTLPVAKVIAVVARRARH
jgi:hypothetical protein